MEARATHRDSMQEGTLRIFRKVFMAITNKQERREETEDSMQTSRSLRQEDCIQGQPRLQSKFKGSLGKQVKPCLKK